MIKFSKIIFNKHDIIPIICVCHSLSLISHYIGKELDEEFQVLNKCSKIISFLLILQHNLNSQPGLNLIIDF